MGIKDEVKEAVNEICSAAWNERDGDVVPKTEDIVMKNGAVNVEATYLYADLADSTGLAHHVNAKVAARVVRSYLNASSKIIRKYDGAIRSFDGDRVMAIYMGTAKNSNAVRTALGIDWAFCEVIKPKLMTKWPKLEALWDMDHAVGVATGEAMIIRGGVRDNNDLVSIGKAPNIAAKLSDIRSTKTLYITKDVYAVLNDKAKFSADGTDMWGEYPDQEIGDTAVAVYASNWWKTP